MVEINFKGFRLQTLLLIQHALGIAICRWVLEQSTYLRTQTNTQIKGAAAIGDCLWTETQGEVPSNHTWNGIHRIIIMNVKYNLVKN